MTRRNRVLGLALFALLAMSAFASAASATPKGAIDTFTDKNAIVTAEDLGTHEFVLTDNSNLSTKCQKAVFTGTVQDKATTAVVHPVYTECTAFGLASTINTTGCDYEFHITTTLSPGPGGASRWDGDVDVECGGGAITITTLTCELKVDTQQTLQTIEAENAGGSGHEMDLTITADVENIAYTVTKDGIGCPLSKVGTFAKGDYTGDVTLKAWEDVLGQEGKPEGITINHHEI